MNILIISNNLKGWTYETLYYEQQLLNKFGKFKYFFWGPGYNFDTNDFLEYEKVLKKKKISIDLIFICLSQQELINKFDYKKYPKTFKIKHKFKKFPLNLDKSKIPKVLLMVDFWVLNKFQWEDILRRYDISSIISSYLFFSVDGKINKEFTTEYTNCLKKFHYMRTIKEIKYFEKKKN